MYRSLFKWPVVCKFSNNASLCVPRQCRKQGTLLFPLLKHTVTNIKYKIFSCKLETSRNTSHQAQPHKKNNLQYLLLFFSGVFKKSITKTVTSPDTSQEENTPLPYTFHTCLQTHSLPTWLPPFRVILWQQEGNSGSVPSGPPPKLWLFLGQQPLSDSELGPRSSCP